MTDDRWDTDDLSLKEDTTGWRQRLERSLQLVHISTLDFCVLWMLEIWMINAEVIVYRSSSWVTNYISFCWYPTESSFLSHKQLVRKIDPKMHNAFFSKSNLNVKYIDIWSSTAQVYKRTRQGTTGRRGTGGRGVPWKLAGHLNYVSVGRFCK